MVPTILPSESNRARRRAFAASVKFRLTRLENSQQQFGFADAWFPAKEPLADQSVIGCAVARSRDNSSNAIP
jgi:hypothetical protein